MKFYIFIIFLYISISSYFLFRFFQNEKDIDKTILKIKKDLKKIFKCCINKKKVEELSSKEVAEELNEEIDKLNGDCKEPFGIPLDVCLDGDLTKEELLIKEKVIKILNKTKLTKFDGGKDKIVVPMESVLFLTKNLNPLVTEDGDINIKITRVGSHSDIPSEELEKLIIELKDGNSILYEDSSELLSSLSHLMKNKEYKDITKEKEIITVQAIEDVNAEAIEEVNIEAKEEPIQKEVKVEIKEEPIEKEIKTEPIEEKVEPKSTEEEIKITEYSPYNPYEEDTALSDDMLNAEMEDFNTNDILNDALSELDLNDENEEESLTVESFYKNLKYRTVNNAFFNFEDPVASISELFKNNFVHKALMSNLAKTQPLIFNGSKTVVYVDQNNILFAIAKMFGMNSKEYIENFKKFSLEELKEINKKLEHILDLKLSDITGGKEFGFYIVEDRKGNKFYLQGFVFTTSSFKDGLGKELDYFRSFPYNSEYSIGNRATAEEIGSLPRLILDMNSVEIK